MIAYLPFFAALVISLILTPLMIKVAEKTKIIDVPSTPHKTHAAPVPYLGGVAIYLALFATTIFFLKMYAWVGIFLTGAGLLCLTGLVDDKYTLDAKAKFVLEGAGCVTLLIAVNAATGVTPPLFFMGVSLFFLWTIVNAVNLVDVMDLIASTTTALSLCGLISLSIIAGHNSLLLLEVIALGAVVGFMWYNKKPASIYLGDAGSLLLGGILGFFILTHVWKSEQFFEIFSIPVVAGVILLEVIALIVIRLQLGLSPVLASPHHYVHFLQRKMWSWNQIIALTSFAGIILNGLVVAYRLSYIPLYLLWLTLFVGLFVWLFIVYSSPKK
ncbi:undecaprenyl/decaprenyl-phosphate alpha-N-acetylglucosaminyl 1-phosphate transferase [Candidatus Dependentiae bacterium]|nr:undecaprenyl/decaprenyl-phosphate alpha-N-acetylglucosaminyl 1-phosphate transferase [Candidatus Dependentiae bacterium]